MKRSLALLFGALLLSIGGASPAGASPGGAPRVADDTVYVAEADPVVVVYETELDTLVVRAEGQAGAPIAAAEGAELDSTVEAQAPPDEPRTPSTRETSSRATTARASAHRRAASSSDGAPSGRVSSGVKEGISVAGLIIDRKDAFHNHWSKPEDASSFTILIAERPLPQFGSQIRVSVGETAVYQGQLRPGYRQIEKAAQRAAARARYYLREFYEPREVY